MNNRTQNNNIKIEKNMKSTEKVIISFAVGLGVGAILGVLFAPSKGSETRQRIKEGFGECCTKVGDMVDEFKEMVTHKGHPASEGYVDDEEV